MSRPRLVYVVSHPVTARVLLRDQMRAMQRAGFDVTLVSNEDRAGEIREIAEREGVAWKIVAIDRPIRFKNDMRALATLTRVLRDLAPDIVNAGTTKAGLIGMMAARAAFVPARVYLLRGLRLETESGILRRVLSATEHVASLCATDVVCVSKSLERVFLAGSYNRGRPTHVLGEGSSNGVDALHFAPEKYVDRARELRRELGIGETELVVGFLGRLVADKGITYLKTAFAEVARKNPRAHLLLVGANFSGDTDRALASSIQELPRVHIVGEVADPAPYYSVMDVLAFPSLREGFPNVPLEAASASLPMIGFRVTGVVDAIVDGKTGMIVEKGDARALAAAITRYLDDDALRRAHGEAGRDRAIASFSRENVAREWAKFYESLLRTRTKRGRAFSLRVASHDAAESRSDGSGSQRV